LKAQRPQQEVLAYSSDFSSVGVRGQQPARRDVPLLNSDSKQADGLNADGAGPAAVRLGKKADPNRAGQQEHPEVANVSPYKIDHRFVAVAPVKEDLYARVDQVGANPQSVDPRRQASADDGT
jgi:hypothetical protein